jgi:CHASE2 domain-containing sensor protein
MALRGERICKAVRTIWHRVHGRLQPRRSVDVVGVLHPLIRLRDWLGRPLPAAAMLTCLALIDPFGLSDTTERASQHLMLRAFAPFYPTDPVPITVLVIDDAFLEGANLSWPLPWRGFRRLLREVLCARPHAVFVDLLLSLPRSGGELSAQPHRLGDDAALSALIDQLAFDPDAAAGKREPGCRNVAPVHLADMLPQQGFELDRNSAIVPQIVEARHMHRVPVNWLADPGEYPLWLEPRELANEAGAWPTETYGGKPLVASAAVSLYRRYLERRAGAASEIQERIEATHQHPHMVVGWGYRPQKAPPCGRPRDDEPGPAAGATGCALLVDFASSRDSSCRLPGEALLGSAWVLTAEFLGSLAGKLRPAFGRGEGEPMQPCPYAYSLPPDVLVTAFGEHRQLMRNAIRGRIVLIGASLRGAPDLSFSPVHGLLPSVFLHAMALDNLIRWDGEDFWRAPFVVVPIGRWEIKNSDIVAIGLIWLLAMLHVGFFRPRQWSYVREMAMVTVIVVGTVFGLAGLLSWAPANWVGVLGLSGTVFAWLPPAAERPKGEGSQ